MGTYSLAPPKLLSAWVCHIEGRKLMPQLAIDQQLGNETPTHRIGPGEIARMANDLFSSMLEMPFNAEPQDSTASATADV
jgi:hypothetical protein